MFYCIFVGIGAFKHLCVSATNMTEDNNLIEKNQDTDLDKTSEIMVDENKLSDSVNESEILQDSGSFDELQQLINSKKEGDTLKLEKDYSGSSELSITWNNFTLDGDGHILDGAGKTRILNIFASGVTLKNIIFKDGATNESGGAISWNGDSGTIIGSSFVNNHADGNGGAIGGSAYSSNNKIINTIFTGNTAQYGGALDWNSGNNTIIGSTFSRNTAENGGSINWGGNDAKIIDSVFEYNNATDGGAVNCYWGENHYISNTRFSNNSAYNGGALYLKGFNHMIVGSTFSRNVAEYGGSVN